MIGKVWKMKSIHIEFTTDDFEHFKSVEDCFKIFKTLVCKYNHMLQLFHYLLQMLLLLFFFNLNFVAQQKKWLFIKREKNKK